MTTAIANGTSEPVLPDGTWSVDPQDGEIGFAVKEGWGLRTVRGVFRAYEGSLTVRAGDATGRLAIETGSLDSGDPKRDRHLCSPTFFDVERNPQIVFTATAVAPRDGGLTVSGELAIGASRVRLEIPVEVEHRDDGALRVHGTTTVSRQAAGVGWNKLGLIGRDTTLHARLTLKRAERR